MKEAVHAPVSLMEFPREMLPPPRAWLGWKYKQIIRHVRVEEGGHFAGLEQPEALARDLEVFISGEEVKRNKVASFLSDFIRESNKEEEAIKEAELMAKTESLEQQHLEGTLSGYSGMG